MREVVFDTETTGLSPDNGDRLVEIGCIELIGRIETGRVYHTYINPERAMPAEAQAVHGLSDAFLADKPRFAEVVDDLLAFLGDDAMLVAHNAAFDFGFLNAELKRHARDPLPLTRMVDTIAMARQLHPGAKHSLDALCSRYGIDRSHRVRHGALLDAELLCQLYIEMTGGRQIGLALAADDAAAPTVQSPRANALASYAGRPWRAPRAHAPSPAELARHSAFIEQIKDALWLESS